MPASLKCRFAYRDGGQLLAPLTENTLVIGFSVMSAPSGRN